MIWKMCISLRLNLLCGCLENQAVWFFCDEVFSNDNELPVGLHLDDAAGLMLFFALAVILHHIVNGFFDFITYLSECSRCWFTADVGAGADDGFLEAEAQLPAELFFCDAYACTAIFCYEIGC